jgi:predicted ester cyclase
MAALNEHLAPDVVDHELPAGLPPGAEGVKLFFTGLRNAFPDLHVTIEDIVAEGDKFAIRTTWTGTHKGELFGIPPTTRHATWSSIEMVRIIAGKAVEHWGVEDQLGLLQQLGVIPPPGQAPQ